MGEPRNFTCPHLQSEFVLSLKTIGQIASVLCSYGNLPYDKLPKLFFFAIISFLRNFMLYGKGLKSMFWKPKISKRLSQEWFLLEDRFFLHLLSIPKSASWNFDQWEFFAFTSFFSRTKRMTEFSETINCSSPEYFSRRLLFTTCSSNTDFQSFAVESFAQCQVFSFASSCSQLISFYVQDLTATNIRMWCQTLWWLICFCKKQTDESKWKKKRWLCISSSFMFG